MYNHFRLSNFKLHPLFLLYTGSTVSHLVCVFAYNFYLFHTLSYRLSKDKRRTGGSIAPRVCRLCRGKEY